MGAILLDEQVAPGTPSMGQVVIYPKSDGELYKKDDTGTEAAMSVSSATTTTEGIVELATQAEMDAGTAGKVPTTDLNKIALGTPIATTSGTAHDFTGIPAGVRRVTIGIRELSTNGTSPVIFQLGTASAFETTNYIGNSWDQTSGAAPVVNAWTTGIYVNTAAVAAAVNNGVITLTLMDATNNIWAIQGSVPRTDATKTHAALVGTKALAGVLTRIRLTTVNGTDAFDSGSVNIGYER